MIVRSTRERHEGDFLILQYDDDGAGRCTARIAPSPCNSEIDSYYEQRAELARSLEGRVLGGELSPLGAYMALYRMTPEETARRTRLRRSKVRAHMSPKGFERARVDELRRYARLFDVTVADLFVFIHLAEGVEAEARRHLGGLLQTVTVGPERR